MDKAFDCGTKYCRFGSCQAHCQSFAANEKGKETHTEMENDKAAQTYEVCLRDMPARIGAGDRAGRHASQARPREMLGTRAGVRG